MCITWRQNWSSQQLLLLMPTQRVPEYPLARKVLQIVCSILFRCNWPTVVSISNETVGRGGQNHGQLHRKIFFCVMWLLYLTPAASDVVGMLS